MIGQIPLVLGIIGDKELSPDDHRSLKESFKALLVELKDEYPDTNIQLLTSLSEVSEQLVAEVGLEIGADIIVSQLHATDKTENVVFEKNSTHNKYSRILENTLESFILPQAVTDNTVIPPLITEVKSRS